MKLLQPVEYWYRGLVMKVLMVTTSYPDYEGSNRGIFIRRLCRELAGQGVEVVVLTPRVFGQSPLFEEETGIKVYRFRYPSGSTPLNQLEKIPVVSMSIYMLSGFLKAVSLIIREKPDVIHGNWIVPTGLIASLAGTFTGKPVINTARGMDVRVSEKGPVKLLFDLAARLSDRLTIVSEAMRSRTALKDAELITSGVNDMFFRVSPGYKGRTAVYTRSLEKVYDAETLIRAVPHVLEKIPDARFLIAGTGSLENEIRKTADELSVSGHVDFLGAVPHHTVAEIMKDASVFVSTATADGTSISLLEAIAAKMIPVATDIEANRALISHGQDGYLFRAGDEKDLARKIIAAFSGSIPLGILDKKSIDFNEMICWNAIAKKFIKNYNRLAGKNSM